MGPVQSLQASAVVQLPLLLQMVNEVALVQLLDPHLPTPVTEGTLCKETEDVLAWPIESGVGGHLLAIVSCLQSDVLLQTYMHIKRLSGQ